MGHSKIWTDLNRKEKVKDTRGSRIAEDLNSYHVAADLSPKLHQIADTNPTISVTTNALKSFQDSADCFTNLLPRRFYDIDEDVRKGLCNICHYDHYFNAHEVDVTRPNYRKRASKIFRHTFDTSHVENDDVMFREFAVSTNFCIENNLKGSFRVFTEYIPASEANAGLGVIKVLFIDPYHLIFPGEDVQKAYYRVHKLKLNTDLKIHYSTAVKQAE